jgi:membrane protease YdiL (CAAX protease family)
MTYQEKDDIMNLLIQTIVNSILQIFIFTLLPFIWWFLSARKKVRFFQWIGLKSIGNLKESRIILWVAATMISFLLMSVWILWLTKDIQTATSVYKGLGIGALPAIVVYAVFNTSFPEEILFRGFLLKRVANKFGFVTGNIVQALLFGLLHGAMFFSLIGGVQSLLIVGFTTLIAWFMGFINEKKGDGSILPSWGIHAMANIFSGICSALLLFG